MDERERRVTNFLSRSIRFCPALFIFGGNPVIGVAGAEFPVWILCLFAGILVTLSLRPVFVAIGVDEWMTPRLVTYSCLALASAFLCWLVVWR
jgi:YtcA-like protein